METSFQISMYIRTPRGFDIYGRFDLGTNRVQAESIVEQLRGTDELWEHSILYMDFTEIRDGIPLPVKILHCTLDDIAHNVRTITKDLFRFEALKK